MTDYKIVGIDLAKTKFHLVALNSKGEKVLSKQVLREELLIYIQTTFSKETLLAMEACGGCHYWGQELEAFGYPVKLLKPKDVKPYAKIRQKNDINDALAIAKAALDLNLKPVHLKNKSEQAISFLHKVRSNTIRDRVQKSNSIQTSLMEFGFVAKVKKSVFSKEARLHIQQAYDNNLIEENVYNALILEAKEIQDLLSKEAELEKSLKALNKNSKRAQLLETIPGIGPINASILSVQAMESYETGRDFSASIGLVPKQSTTGGKAQLGSITKQGNRYIRTMLIQGARSIVIRGCKENPPQNSLYTFAQKLYERKGFNLASVAVANKLARVAYACVIKQEAYKA